MKPEHIEPFVDSVISLFETMLGTQVQQEDVPNSAAKAFPSSLSAIIGLSGASRWTISLNLPVETALAVAGRISGEDFTTVDADVSDTIAEMANIVAGAAKAKLPSEREPLRLSLPTIIQGDNVNISPPRGTRWVEIPFSGGLGAFVLRVAFEG